MYLFKATKMTSLDQISYETAFDLSHIYQKHRPLMIKLGVDDNVLLNTLPPLKGEIMSDDEQSFRNDCLSHLEKCRVSATLSPFYEALVSMAVVGALSVVGQKIMGDSPTGGAVSAGIGIIGLTAPIGAGIGGLSRYFFPIETPINQLEEKFVLNQHLIPRTAWPVIIESFKCAGWTT